MKPLFSPTQVTLSLFAVYLVALYWIIVLKFNITAYHDGVERVINWIPYREAVLYGNMNLNETLMNVFIFVPFGLYSGILLERWNLFRKFALFLSVSFFFEVSQFILKVGAFDVTDLINNTLGGLLGLMLFKALERSFATRVKAQKFTNIMALVGTVAIFSLLLFLKINNLWIFRMQLLDGY